MLLASYTIGPHCLYPEDRARKWDKVNSAEYRRTLTRRLATTCIGFLASEGQRKVCGLLASAVVDSCLNYSVESCILRARYMSSNSLSCDIFATLTQEIVTCPSCGLERLLFVRNLAFSEGWSYWKDLYFVRLLIKFLKKCLPRNNRSAYANVIHVMHETSRPIRTRDSIGCHGNYAKLGSLGEVPVNELVAMATARQKHKIKFSSLCPLSLHSTPLHSTPLPPLPPLHSTPLHSTPLHSTPLHSTPLHSTPLHSTPLHSTPLHSTPLHSTPLHSTPLHSLSIDPSLAQPRIELGPPALEVVFLPLRYRTVDAGGNSNLYTSTCLYLKSRSGIMLKVVKWVYFIRDKLCCTFVCKSIKKEINVVSS